MGVCIVTVGEPAVTRKHLSGGDELVFIMADARGNRAAEEQGEYQ